MQPRQLSCELREGQSPSLARRRWIVGLSLLRATMGQIVSLYQTGIIKHLPDPPPRDVFNADKVDASNYAYKRMSTPDGLMMTASYAISAWLAGADGEDRAQRNPMLPLAMGAKLAGDVALAGKLAQEEWSENKALCAYCQVATACSVAALALAVPELLEAASTLTSRSRNAPSVS